MVIVDLPPEGHVHKSIKYAEAAEQGNSYPVSLEFKNHPGHDQCELLGLSHLSGGSGIFKGFCAVIYFLISVKSLGHFVHVL